MAVIAELLIWLVSAAAFVGSSGIFFRDRHRHNPVLTVVAGAIAFYATVELISATVGHFAQNDSRVSAHDTGGTVVSPFSPNTASTASINPTTADAAKSDTSDASVPQMPQAGAVASAGVISPPPKSSERSVTQSASLEFTETPRTDVRAAEPTDQPNMLAFSEIPAR